MQMFETAKASDDRPLVIKDVVELIADSLPEPAVSSAAD
jgi:hypothetical protein